MFLLVLNFYFSIASARVTSAPTCANLTSGIIAQRACIHRCPQRDQSQINACAQDSFNVEKNEYHKVVTQTQTRIDITDMEVEERTTWNARFRDYQNVVISHLQKKCSFAALQMLGGSSEVSILYGCMATEYREATQLMNELVPSPTPLDVEARK
jgi:uncharacterized protein YecT (DUF1311 family)